MKRGALVFLLFFVYSGFSYAQVGQFGKNPMRTNPELKDLYIISSGQVDVIYYPSIDSLARFALPIADKFVTEMTEKYQHQLPPDVRVTINLFAGQENYAQFWVFPFIQVPPSGGVTEGFKGNIALPFDGMAGYFYQTIGHEVAHRFQYSKIEETYSYYPLHDAYKKKVKKFPLPVWWMEGEATYLTSESSDIFDIYLRFVVVNGLVPSLEELSRANRSIFSYILGAEVFRFLSGEYDPAILREIKSFQNGLLANMNFGDSLRVSFYENMWRYPNFSEAMEGIYGASLSDINKGFQLYLKLKYFPEYGKTFDVGMFAAKILTNGWYNYPFVYSSADGKSDALFYVSAEDGYISIYSRPIAVVEKHCLYPQKDIAVFDGVLKQERPVGCVEKKLETPRYTAANNAQRIVKGRTEQYETLQGPFDVYQGRDSLLLVFSAKRSALGTEGLVVWDVLRRNEVSFHRFDDFVSIYSPSWSPDGKKIAFAGMNKLGIADIYIFDRENNTLTNITNDIYYEGELDWSPTGDAIVFSSDRSECGDYHKGSVVLNLFMLNPENGEIRYLTNGCWSDRYPRFSPDGERILFVSSRFGTSDLFVVNRYGDGARLTNVSTGIFSPSWFAGGRVVVFSAFDGGQNIYAMDLPDIDSLKYEDKISLDLSDSEWQPTWEWREINTPLARLARFKKFPDQYHLTFANGGSSAALGIGTRTSFTFLFTNLVNTKMIYTTFQSATFRGGGRLINLLPSRKYEQMRAEIGFINLSGRLFYGGRCYRNSGLFIDGVYRNIYGEDNIGCGLFGIYPFSRFRRTEISVGAEYSDQADYRKATFSFKDIRQVRDSITYTRRAVLLRLGGAYVKDNSLWVPGHPISGLRYRFDCGIDADFANLRPDSYYCLSDFRKYLRISLRSAIGLRAFGYYSDGFTPRRIAFDWLNHMKLYPMYNLFGDRVWIFNADYRFPLLDKVDLYFPFGAINLPAFQAALFFDAGQVWLKGEAVGPIWGDYGIRFTTNLYIVTLALNWGRMFAWRTDGINLPSHLRGTQFKVTIAPNF